MILISIIIALIVLIIASLTDLHNREVPDYVSYGLIFITVAITVIYSIVYSDYRYFAQSIMGLIIGLIIAYSMFYLGQWGGGDSKLIIGLGMLIGFNTFPVFGENNYWLLILLACIIFCGAIYGLSWSIVLALQNRRIFIKNFKILIHTPKISLVRNIVLICVIFFTLLTFFLIHTEDRVIIFLFILLCYMMFYMWVFVKVIEETCMIKDVSASQLTEGDWIYKDIFVGKKYVAGPKDLGVSKEQIALLTKYSKSGKIKKITIKEGIPFVPAFLFAFIVMIVMYYRGLF